MFLQETFVITDAQFYDKGLSGTGNHNDNWNTLNYFTRTDTGTIYNPSTEWARIVPMANGSDDFTIGNGLIVEFDVVDLDVNNGQIRWIIYDGSNRQTLITTTGHYKAVITDKIYFYDDDTLIYTSSYDTSQSTIEVRFTNSVANAMMKFKDLMVYNL